MVQVDWDAHPLPEVPFPNDLSTVVDQTSSTGLRLNLPTSTDTHFESETREKINELTGFGVYAPITVSFDKPLDIANMVDRHPNDLHLEATFDDDAVYLVNVDVRSDNFGALVHLDMGHGRYPADAFETDRYFFNDTRSQDPSILFDTTHEDLNGNGVLDPGEDTDNDGILDDKPNIFPLDGDPFEDLLTFYDRASDTLIMRPVVPLEEGTTYAVVLTDRLIGEDGEPVRSPWTFVNHTRQTRALLPLIDVLPTVGLGLDNIAYAWTFTTGEPTKDLRDIRDGMYTATGPYHYLAEAYPPAVVEAHVVNDVPELEPLALPMERITNILIQLELAGAADDPGVQVLVDWFDDYTGELVGGTIETPYFLTDVDDGGRWDADEWWKLDPYTGDAVVAPQRVAFTCVTPNERLGFQQPYPIVFYGHGYGSNRLEVLLFSAVFNRFGIAACSFDFPGHGATASDDDLELATTLLSNAGLSGTVRHLFDGRFRDLDNDGRKDSGGDQWVADPFHTRDMVRQAVVDWMHASRTFRACGEGTMTPTEWGPDGKPVLTDQTRLMCDWNNDGVPDIGGPDAKQYIIGGSLGGINSGVAAAVIPGITAWAPIVPAGGLVDVGTRTAIGGAVEAFVGKLITPLVLGIPDETGLQVLQMTNTVTSMSQLPMGRLDRVPVGGTVRVTNLDKGMVREGMIPEDGRFRLAIGADAMNAGEKAIEAGIPETGPEPDVIYEIGGNDGLGDQLLVEIFDADGVLVATFDTWPEDVLHEGITMRAGSPIVAGNEGSGRIRGTSEARRIAYVAGMVLEAGDPIAYAPHYFRDPFDEVQNVLIMPTPGDDQVPVSAGIAMARAAGLVDWQNIDPRYGTTVDQWLIDRQVIRGVEERGPYTDDAGNPVLFDIDDFDEGTDGYGAPSDTPLRVDVETEVGVSGMRMPYVSPRGTHGFGQPDPSLDFDIHTYALMLIGDYLFHDGAQIGARACYEDASCPDFPTVAGGDP